MDLPEPQILIIGDMELDVERGRLSKGERSSSLGPMKAKVFVLFALHPNRVWSEESIRLLLYGSSYRGDSAVRTILVLCRHILRKLQSESEIRNVKYHGWEFLPPA